MADYPAAITAPRTMVNRPGVTYDALKTKVIYAEDFNKDRAEIVAIETELGLNPKGGFADVAAYLAALASAVGGIVTDFLGLSDTPSSYVGQGGKVVAVKADVSGLEFIAAPGGAVDFIDLGDVPASYTDQAGKVAAVNGTEDGLEFIAPGGGEASTELGALIDPQLNVSSVGDTYTDTVGNTYAETTNQTRLTLHATRQRYLRVLLSGHVSAGTGTFQLWNHTDSAQLGTPTTTTSTSEILIGAIADNSATNIGDVITLRVKNSGAGGTITIDAGGFVAGDTIATFDDAAISVSLSSGNVVGQYHTSVKFALIGALSTAAITIQQFQKLSLSTGDSITNTGNTFGTAEKNTLITRSLAYRIYGNVCLQFAVTGRVGTWLAGVSADYRVINN